MFGLTLNPIMFLVLFAYVFGGALAGTSHAYLQFALPASSSTPSSSPRGHRPRAGRRYQHRDVRQVPQLADSALGAAGRRDRRRPRPLRRLGRGGPRLRDGARIPGWNPAGSLPPPDACSSSASPWLSAGSRRWSGLLVKTAAEVQRLGFLVMFPLAFGSNVSSPREDARLAAGVRAGESDDGPDQRDPRADGRRPGRRPALKSLAWAIGLVVVFAPLAVAVYRRKT